MSSDYTVTLKLFFKDGRCLKFKDIPADEAMEARNAFELQYKKTLTIGCFIINLTALNYLETAI